MQSYRTATPIRATPVSARDTAQRERNRLLLAGGFAPAYLELPYDGTAMQPLRASLRQLLEAHEPSPALIVDGPVEPDRGQRGRGHPSRRRRRRSSWSRRSTGSASRSTSTACRGSHP